MKHKSLILLIGLCFLASCSLEERPTTSLSKESIYSSEAGLEASVIGCYNEMLSKQLWCGRMTEFLQNGSLLTHWKAYRQPEQWTQSLDLTLYSTDSNNQGMYTKLYSIIYRCNDIIDNIPASPVDEKFKAEIEGEARLIRAICYFYAVRMWGDLPLLASNPVDLADANRPRTSYIKVYEQILDDLAFAEANMRSPQRVMEVSGTTGRPNKWAATSFKSLVLLQIASMLTSPDDQPFSTRPDFSETDFSITSAREAWEFTLQVAEHVINNGPYELAYKYTDLFRWTDAADWQLPERIFVIQSTDNGTGDNNLAAYTLPEYPEGTLNVSAKNANFGRIRPSRWFYQKFAGTYGGVMGSGESNGNIYVGCQDPRFDATFIHNKYHNLNTAKDVKIYPDNSRITTVDAKGSERYAQPYFRKYLDPRYNAGSGYSDFYMLRYAEILLTAAEAAAQLSEGPGDAYWAKATGYVEQLHARARRSVTDGAPEAEQPKWNEGRFTDKQALVNAIVFERFYEMSCEGHEWFDTHRYGAQWVIDNITTPVNEFLALPEQGPGADAVTNPGYFEVLHHGHVYATTVDQVLKGLLCAFPENELRNNSALDPGKDQNKYYIK